MKLILVNLSARKALIATYVVRVVRDYKVYPFKNQYMVRFQS